MPFVVPTAVSRNTLITEQNERCSSLFENEVIEGGTGEDSRNEGGRGFVEEPFVEERVPEMP